MTPYFEGLLLWILGIDPIFQEEALLILTTVVISFSFDSEVAMVSLEKKTDKSEQYCRCCNGGVTVRKTKKGKYNKHAVSFDVSFLTKSIIIFF